MLQEKLALIYEYNKKSPLFVRAADKEISQNNLHTAVDILKNGLKNYPAYPTAYILLGKVLVLLGEYKQAENAFSKGTGFINSKSTFEYYLNEMERKRSEESLYSESRRISFAPAELNVLVAKPNNKNEKSISEVNAVEFPVEEKSNEFEDNLDLLVKKISGIKIVVDENKPIPDELYRINNDDNEIVSETLAKIYKEQGKYNEAIDVFEKLKIKYPNLKDDYQKRIDELNIQVSNLD